MIFFETIILYNLIKKLIRSGNQHKALQIKKFLVKIEKNRVILNAISKLLVPFSFKNKKIGHITYSIPVNIHYYKSINLALKWLIKAAKLKSHNKMSFFKAFYFECLDVIKNQGLAYNYKQQYIKKALVNRIFVHLIWLKKNNKIKN